jgi:hypothetical protein
VTSAIGGVVAVVLVEGGSVALFDVQEDSSATERPVTISIFTIWCPLCMPL